MAFIRTEVISLGGSKPELREAYNRLSEAHSVLVHHQGSFPTEGDNPLELTRRAMDAIQKILENPAS